MSREMLENVKPKKLTFRQRRGIKNLLISPTIIVAAERTGVNQQTMYRWLKQPLFMAEYSRQQPEVIAQLSMQFLGGHQMAMNALARAMVSARAEGTQVRAAEIWFSQMHLFREEGEFEKRLSELEKRIATT